MDESLMTKYSEILSRYMKVPTVIILIGIAIVVLGFIIVLKFKCLKEFAIYFILGIGVLVAVYFFTIFPIQKDIKTNAYTKYSGNFFVEDYYYVNRGSSPYILIKLPNEKDSVRYKISGNFENITNNTTYKGSFVYGKNSKTIIDISIY